MKVVVSTRARRDLIEIGDIIAKDDRERADSFTAELIAAAHGLADFPERFPLIPQLARQRIRRRAYDAYLIVYRVEGSRVEIIRFLHGARDYVAIMQGKA